MRISSYLSWMIGSSCSARRIVRARLSGNYFWLQASTSQRIVDREINVAAYTFTYDNISTNAVCNFFFCKRISLQKNRKKYHILKRSFLSKFSSIWRIISFTFISLVIAFPELGATYTYKNQIIPVHTDIDKTGFHECRLIPVAICLICFLCIK